MIDEDVLPYVRERLPDFSPIGEPVRLPDGNLNRVWRVSGAERSVIVKHAPPYVAANPDVPLDPSRLLIEAKCLRALGPGGELKDLTDEFVRPPRPIDVNPDDHVLVMEDFGEVPSLGPWMRSGDRVWEKVPGMGRRLGRFIGRLHAATLDDPAWAEAFDNRPMQETRYAVQYQGVADMLSRAGVSDAEALGERAELLGERLLDPGRCLTMGDLWPPSVLMVEEGLRPDRRERPERSEEVLSGAEVSRKPSWMRLIDWELAHYGRPLQDVAHWLAHLWMQEHRAPSPAVATAVEDLRASFLESYREALGEVGDTLWTETERRGAALHFGAEILVRAVGPFQEGYVYEGLDPNHPAVQEAVATATQHLRSPEAVDVLAP